MTISQALGDDLCVKLRSVGIPREYALPLVNQISRQVACEGPENVVKRLKSLKQAGIDVLSGKKPSFPWIAHDTSGPKGPWKPVWKMLQSSQYKHRKRAINTLMVYSTLIAKENEGPTKTQERKFLSSVVQTDTRVQMIEKSTGPDLVSFSRIGSWIGSKFGLPKQEPVEDGVIYCSRIYGTDEIGAKKTNGMFNRLLKDPGLHPFHRFSKVREALGPLGQDYSEICHPYHQFYGDYRELTPEDVESDVGVIGFSQEPGYKFRAFASPNRVIQCALEPLKHQLLDLCKRLPCDFTHNQDAGVERVQKWLSQGCTVYSVDLSDATNNFPLQLQESVLKGLGIPDEDISLMRLVSRSPYKPLWSKGGESIRWNVGQPLGAGPSFPMFALSHTAFALKAASMCGLSYNQALEHFNVLGDDFVTNHSGLHDKYRELLSRYGIPVSEAKCLTSNLLGEFAGKLISDRFVYHGFKYKEMTDRSFMPMIRSLGRQAISKHFLTPTQLAYARAVMEFPEPYGLGFNPRGIPFEKRYEAALIFNDLVQEIKIRKDPTLSPSQIKNAFLMRMDRKLDKWMMYYPPEPLKARPSTGKVLLESVRGESLLTAMITTGDPRPAVVEELSASKLVTIGNIVKMRMGFIPSVDLDSNSPRSGNSPTIG